MPTTPTIEELTQRAKLARRAGRSSEALRDAEEAVALCRQSGPRRNLVRALMLLGQLERDRSHRVAALECYEEAVTLSRKVDSPLRFAHTLRHLGDLYGEMGKLALAEPCFEKAIAICRANETSSLDLANAIRGFAVMKDAAGDSGAARLLWQEARDLYLELGIGEGVEECDGRLGM